VEELDVTGDFTSILLDEGDMQRHVVFGITRKSEYRYRLTRSVPKDEDAWEPIDDKGRREGAETQHLTV